MKTLVANRQVTCGSSRDVLWPALADTDRLNRIMKSPALSVIPATDGAARFAMEVRLGGLKLRYFEDPFEWEAPERWRIRRRFASGPLASYAVRLVLAEAALGTTVDIAFELTPRSFLTWPLARLSLGMFARKLGRAIATIDDNLKAGADPAHGLGQSRARTGAVAQALATLEAAVPAADRELARRLAAHIKTADDAELVRIRPYDLARSWEVEPRRMLTLCLHGVVAGLLDLSWEIICPSCRSASDTVTTLAALGDEAHCQLCDISIAVDLDRAVEATVRPARAIRQVATGPFCIGGPYRTPHVLAQAILPASGTARLIAPEEPGRYRLFCRGGGTCSVEVAGGERELVEVGAGTELSPAQIAVAPGASIAITETSGEDRHVKIEHLEWASAAATAHDVVTTPAFRSLFSAEVLRPGLSLRVARAALLFTDLAGSTALYAEAGDAAAYTVVQAHFVALASAARDHGGTIVKTIGDAVMAAFPTGESAARAAVAMLRAYRDLGADYPLTRRMQLRVGGYCGPCYMVTANDVLDYFGQTVNIASRIQGLAEDNGVVLPEDLIRRCVAAGWFSGLEISPGFTANLRGIPEPVTVARICLAKSAVPDSERAPALPAPA